MSGGKEKDDVRRLRIVAALALALAPSAAWAQPAAAIQGALDAAYAKYKDLQEGKTPTTSRPSPGSTR